MSAIRLRLAEYLKQRGLTTDDLLKAIGTVVNPNDIYQLLENGEEQQVDLPTLATVMQALRKLMGFPVGIEEVMQFVPDRCSEEMNPETNPWYELDADGEIPSYDWGDVDPLEGCKPIHYISDLGIVVEDGDKQIEHSGEANT